MTYSMTYEEIQALEGRRVRAINFGPSQIVDDNETVPPGTEGTIHGGSPKMGYLEAQLWVKWDNGSTINLLVGVDRYELIEGSA